MDVVPLVYYALVCSILSGFVPAGLPRLGRAGIGALVGVAAALSLYPARAALGL